MKQLAAMPISALSFLLAHAAATRASPTNDVLFAFTGGNYSGWRTWDWEAMTHLGFWTKPADDVRTMAKKHGVKLFHDCSTPTPKDWVDASKRATFAKSCADDVRQHGFAGVFFDYEGNGLSKAEKSGYTELAQAVAAALRPLNATLMVCVGGRPSYELRDYDYAGLAAAADFLFVMGYDLHLYDDYTCVKTSQGRRRWVRIRDRPACA